MMQGTARAEMNQGTNDNKTENLVCQATLGEVRKEAVYGK